MKDKKEIRVTIRFTSEQYETIASKAERANLAVGTYIRSAALRHRVTVIEGLKELTHELKSVGRNLNQLAILAHQGRLQTIDLAETLGAMERVYARLSELAGQERH